MFLIVSRKEGEMIVVDEGRVIVKVAEVRGSRIKLGVATPEGTTVDRLEVYQRKVADGAIKPGQRQRMAAIAETLRDHLGELIFTTATIDDVKRMHNAASILTDYLTETTPDLERIIEESCQ